MDVIYVPLIFLLFPKTGINIKKKKMETNCGVAVKRHSYLSLTQSFTVYSKCEKKLTKAKINLTAT